MENDISEESEVFDFEKICRLCLLEKPSMMKQIFTKKNANNLTPLPIRIMSCTSLEVYQGDGLPSTICTKCLWSVNQAYKFREQCELANTRLQKYLHRMKESSNPSSSNVQFSIENETQEAIPLEYLNAQVTISEQPTGSVDIKKEDSDIKSEPEAIEAYEDDEEGDHNELGETNEVEEEDEEEEEEEDDDEEEDDKPISELFNFARATPEVSAQSLTDESKPCVATLKEEDDLGDVSDELLEATPEDKMDGAESAGGKPTREILQTPRPTRRFLHSEFTKDPTYNSHKRFFILGNDFNKIKKKPLKTSPQDKPVKMKLVKPGLMGSRDWETIIDKPRRKYAPREKNLISNNSNPIIEQDGSKSKFRACTHCGKVVLGKNMGIHVKIHVGNKSHLCDICGKSFLYKKTLETHKRVHSGERPCVCKICGKTFRSSSRLSDHMSTHTGRKPFICEICAVAFRIKGHLKKHLRVHSGEKPYICTFCEKAFSDAWNMKCHLRIHTGEKPPHSCPVCGQCFLRRNKMEEHCKVTHGEEYVLPRKQNIVQRLMNDLVDPTEEMRPMTDREREELMRQEAERQLLQSHLESQRAEMVERFSQEGHVSISVPMALPVPVPAFPGNIPGIFGLQ